jgi:HlyD family secretion protein
VTRRRTVVLAVIAVVLLLGGGYYYYNSNQRALPAGIIGRNGQIEAEEIAIATKYAGRIAEMKFMEGDEVKGGQVLARMDTSETEASLRAQKAITAQRIQDRDSAASQLRQREAEFDLAKSEFDRGTALLAADAISRQRVDQQRTRVSTTQDAVAVAKSAVQAAEAAIAASNAEEQRMQHQIDDATLIAPKPGRVLYKTAQAGETLPAGGQVGSLLDLSNVYLTMFLTSAESARASLGTQARIVIDAVPDRPIPAVVSFISPRAQYTPKQVETQEERERMMFRVKLRIPPELVEKNLARVKTGMLGMGYVRLDQNTQWPEWLESDLTTTTAAK